MNTGDRDLGRGWRWAWIILIVGAAVVLVTPGGRAAGTQLFASLRLARPNAVRVAIPAFSGPTGTRRLQDAVAAMLADSVHVLHASSDSAAPDAAAAARLAGFAPALPSARHDRATFGVESAREVTMSVKRGELRTILAEAGRSRLTLPSSIDGATLAISTPPAVRTRYGHCPAADSTSLQNQLAGPPPPTTDNGDCIVLVQRRAATALVPPGLDLPQLVAVALEVAGMSPKQASDFQQRFGWQAALALTMPRFMRSYDTVRVNGAPAMLLNTAGRRGPTYDLVWTASGFVYSLEGYGSAADAVPLASSIR